MILHVSSMLEPFAKYSRFYLKPFEVVIVRASLAVVISDILVVYC